MDRDTDSHNYELLVKDLWESDEANSLTNSAARAIESLQAEIERLERDVAILEDGDR